MTAQQIRKKYLDFFAARQHKLIPRASLVPQDDPTTLFTGSGMQPLIPYLLGEKHPDGNRLADSQTCFRAEDMDEVGDNRHTTFFEMLGNWSLGDYYKQEQINWAWELYTDVFGLDPKKLYVSCFMGDKTTGVPKDSESAKLWQELYTQAYVEAETVDFDGAKDLLADPKNRIFYYDATKNWWSREGEPKHMRDGEPGGPDSEIFYDFGTPHDDKFGKYCHPNCDCGRFLEIGNNVFMAYRKVGGKFEKLPKPNVDFGGGLERIAAAVNDNPDMFQVSVIGPIIDGLEELSGKSYGQYQSSMRVIADHLRAAVFLAVDGVTPSNKQQGYVMRRLIRRAIRYAFDLGIEQDVCEKVANIIASLYEDDFPEVKERKKEIAEALTREEKLFRHTLRTGLRELEKISKTPKGVINIEGKFYEKLPLGKKLSEGEQLRPGAFLYNRPLLTGEELFKLQDTHGFPVELSLEESYRLGIPHTEDWMTTFDRLAKEQRRRSQTASAGMFKGGLADHSEQVVKYHTATHLMYQALKNILGPHVIQRGSNITAERTRFDFSHPQKMTLDEIAEVEKTVNEKIAEDLPVSWKEEATREALKTASGAFGDKYGDKVKVYTIGNSAKPFSREICGGPHVEHTGQIGAGGKQFKIIKEEASSAGVRRIKAVLE